MTASTTTTTSVVCSCCQGQAFGPGPDGRKGKEGRPPLCLGCRSLERHRILARVLEFSCETNRLFNVPTLIVGTDIPVKVANLFRAAVHMPIDQRGGLDGSKLASDAEFELVVGTQVLNKVSNVDTALAEMTRRVSAQGLLCISYASPMYQAQNNDWGAAGRRPNGVYRILGREFEAKLFGALPGFKLTVALVADPVTQEPDLVYLASRDPAWTRRLEVAAEANPQHIIVAPVESEFDHQSDHLVASRGVFLLRNAIRTATTLSTVSRNSTSSEQPLSRQPISIGPLRAGHAQSTESIAPLRVQPSEPEFLVKGAVRQDGDLSIVTGFVGEPLLSPSGDSKGDTAPAASIRPRAAGRPDFRALAAAAFDETHYRRALKQDLAPSADALGHWWDYGRHAGVDPHPLFNTDFYCGQIQDKSIQKKDAFLYFLHHGANLDLDPHPCFSQLWYRSRYPEREHDHPWLDYISLEDRLLRDPNWLFCSQYVAGLLSTSASNHGTLLAVFLSEDNMTSPHLLLDYAFLRKHNAASLGTHEGEYTAFWRAYRKGEFRTSYYFDPAFYNGQQRASGCRHKNLLMDYILVGEKEGLKANPLFDAAWYASSYEKDPAFNTYLEDYIFSGEKLYHSPCPGFDPRYYLECNSDVARAGDPPLKHYLATGQKEGRRPHARFDVAFYKTGLDENDAIRPLEHFLEQGRHEARTPHPAIIVEQSGVASQALTSFFLPTCDQSIVVPRLHNVLAAPDETSIDGISPSIAGQAWLVDQFEAQVLLSSPIKADRAKRHETIVRQYEYFDENASIAFADELQDRFAKSQKVIPRISVIVPTRNRARVLQRAISSILGQTHRNIQVLIVDDGSTDGTDDLVKKYFADPRIRYIQTKASGVSAARNVGLAHASGKLIAYLDSDNYWEPRHLELTAMALLLNDASSAYSVLRLFNRDGAVRFRGDSYSAPALKRENYIDMNVYMHRREVSQSGIGFDESLRRCVDWDFILKATALGDPLFVPVIGCNYVEDNDTLERITTDELSGDYYKVCQHNIDLAPHIVGRISSSKPRLSIIWPISSADWPDAKHALWQMLRHLTWFECEVIVINNALPTEATNYLNAVANHTVGLRVINLWRTFFEYPAANLAFTLARGREFLLWRSGVEYEPAVVQHLVETFDKSDISISIPIVIGPDGLVSTELGSATLSSYGLLPVLTGQAPPISTETVTGLVPVASPVVIRADAFSSRGGFSARFARHLGLADFALRILAENSSATALHLGCRLRSIKSLFIKQVEKERVKELEEFRAQWFGKLEVRPCLPSSMKITQPVRREYESVGWNLLPSRYLGARIASPSLKRSMRFVIRCPAPDSPQKLAWGDYFYAMSMIAALERAGHSGCIEHREAWSGDRADGDIVLHLRGIVETKPVRGKLNAMWIISHPESISSKEYGGMDVVFAAGQALCDHLYTSRGINAHLLLQATDRFSFSLDQVKPRSELYGKPLFIGNSRMHIRPIVIDAVQLNLPIVVRGQGWESFIPRRFIHGDLVPNDEVVEWYGSAGVVLNDHWLTMREYGIISNRLFDVAASGRPLITDAVEGIEDIFGNTARIYRTKEELATLVEELAQMPIGERSLVETSRRICEDHSFDARIATILSVLNIARR